jgi:D-alanyl-D-alanine carboxypeptidase
VFADDRYAAIVIDASTNEVLHADQADELRFPASLTKMMTLYIVFEELEKGRLDLDDRIAVSRRASRMPASRLGLRQGSSISVDDAIRALVTRSANDVATAVAEHMDGSESRFAARMTTRARALGMVSTRFVNASGLPDPSQRTTARDMARLSSALLNDFPQHFNYFQTREFWFRNLYSRNHNALLGRVEGVDGIKTGYTRASGFNLATSVTRNGQRLFTVVMGGASAAERDAQVAYLIETAYSDLDARARGMAPAPAATYTMLPVNRVSVTAPTATPGAATGQGSTPPPALFTAPVPPAPVVITPTPSPAPGPAPHTPGGANGGEGGTGLGATPAPFLDELGGTTYDFGVSRF